MERKRVLWMNVALGGLLGAVLFCVVYGVRILDVGYDDWLLRGGDLSQHYLGWRFFRSSPWHFPVGLMSGILEPLTVSVTYTDSIPLFALPFKLLSPLLPDTFQYFGLWGLFSFMAQGAFAVLLLRRFTEHLLLTLPGAAVFILSPVMLYRMYLHTALAGHWIILSALCLWIYHGELRPFSRRLTLWSIQGMLAALIHPYFLPMMVIIAFCAMLQNWMMSRHLRENLLLFAAPIVAALLTLFLLGAFQGGGNATESGLGVYSANLNALLNSAGHSYFMNALPLLDGQGEGFGYLGFGMVLGAAIAVTLVLLSRKAEGKPSWEKGFPVLLAVGAFVILAVSPRVTLGQHVLWEWPLPSFLTRLLSMFRASGRFIWPVVYLFYLGVFAVILQKAPRRAAVTLLSIILVFQMVDLKGMVISRRQTYGVPVESTLTLQKEILWEEATRGRKHLVILEPEISVTEHEKGYALAILALENGMTMNSFNVARLPLERVREEIARHMEELASGGDQETLYVSARTDVFRGANLTIHEADGLFFAVGGE